MKLLQIINIRYLLSSVITVVLLGVVLNFALSYVSAEETDEKLMIMYSRFTKQLKEGKLVCSMPPYFEVNTIPYSPNKITFENSNLKSFEDIENEEVRLMTAIFNYNGITYRIVARELKVESDDLFEAIFILVFIALALLLGTLYLLNYQIAKSIWKGFYENLDRMKNFSLQSHDKLELRSTKVLEFSELNLMLENLSSQVINDYLVLKQFTEDASHEIQTPLAIITSKIETLLNDRELSTQQFETLSSIEDSVARLSRLNKNLVLLARLENKQFIDTSPVNFQELLTEKVKEFEELTELKGIAVACIFKNKLIYELNPVLAEILVANLLSNAINHVTGDKNIRIEIKDNQLIFANSGESRLVKPDAVFNRFYKENPSSKSVGLGLAIVKKICDNYSISIQYSFESATHRFVLSFPL